MHTSLMALPRAFYDGLDPIDDKGSQGSDQALWTSETMERIAIWTKELEQALETDAGAYHPTKFVKLISTPFKNTKPCEWDVRLTVGGGGLDSDYPLSFYAVILGPQGYHRGIVLDSDVDVSTLQIEIMGNGNLLLTSNRSEELLKPQGRSVPVVMNGQSNHDRAR